MFIFIIGILLGIGLGHIIADRQYRHLRELELEEIHAAIFEDMEE